MARTKQKKQKDLDLAKGSCGKREISTIRQPGHQKDALTFQEKLTILDKMQKMKWSQKQTSLYYSNKGYGARISQSNISRWLKDKEKMEAHVGAGGVNPTTRRTRRVHHPELEAALTHWVEQREAKLLPIKGGLIKVKAERLVKALGINGLKLSDGWLAAFKERHMLQDRRIHGEAGSVDPKDADTERERMRNMLRGRDPEFVFNCDETSFFWQAIDNHGLSTKAVSGKKLDKVRMSVLVIINATGTRKIQLLFIGNAKQPRCFKKKTAKQWGFWYFHNKTAWMTSEIFSKAMETLDAEFREEGIHTTMLLDNFSGHKWRENKISNIEFIFFAPKLTSHVQPADAGIIRTLKAHYRRLTLIRSLDREEAGEDDPLAIDLLTAMHLLKLAWEEVTPATIAACWRHTGILPTSFEALAAFDTVPEVEAAVEEASKALANLNIAICERSGQRKNLAKPTLVDDIEELLEDPPDPEWMESEDDETALIAVVSLGHPAHEN